jgi:penicillin-binding protein 2
MSSLAMTIIISVVVFLAALVVLTAIVRFRQRRQRGLAIKQSFVRHSAPAGLGINDVRRPDTFNGKEKKEGRGRLYAFGLVIAGIFGTLAMRLWSLQLISGDSYQKQAEDNMTSEASTPATRGRILDRNGKELVGNRPSLCVTAPKRVIENPIAVHMLSQVLGVPKGVVRRNLLNDAQGAQADRVIAADVPMHVVSYIKEHQSLFDGVEVAERTIRTYPYGNVAAHVLGYIGPVTQADLLLPQKTIIYEGGDYIGKSGAEFAFENLLQGVRGKRTYKVDVDGNPLAMLSEQPPTNGSDVCLTIDADLQQKTDQILADVIASSHQKGFIYANAGALVCIDVTDGGILASSSYPTFDPSQLSIGISDVLWEELNREGSGYPLTNRVTSGLYAAASTFKAFISLAGLKHGIIGDTYHNCTGFWEEYGEEWGQRCWIFPNGHGYLGLEEAINQSCDVFFYNVASSFWHRWNEQPNDEKTNPLQDYVRSWGFGEVSGVDIPGEMAGRIPDSQWKKGWFADTPEAAQWRPGDMTNMCIGQGDVLVTPLQICNGYAGIARRKMLKPHFFHQALNHKGQVVVYSKPEESPVQPEFDDYSMSRVEDGLIRVVNRFGGKFSQLPVSAAGKSGTAEVASAKADFSWFVAYAPVGDPKYCVACVVEQAGDGSSAAILGVQHTLAAVYGVDVGEIIVEQGSRER